MFTGMRIEIGCPSASPAEYPNIRSAPAFQLVMRPLRSWVMMASSADSTMAADTEPESWDFLAFVAAARSRMPSRLLMNPALNRTNHGCHCGEQRANRTPDCEKYACR